jgi:hypothetical protein
MDMEDLAKYFIREEPTKGFNWVIAIPPDREHLIAELYDGNIQFGEINQDEGVLVLEIHREPNDLPWRFSLHQLIDFLRETERELTGDPSDQANSSSSA